MGFLLLPSFIDLGCLAVYRLVGSPLEEKCRIFFPFNCCEPPLGGEEEEETACVFYAIIKSSTTSLLHLSSSSCFIFDSVSLSSEDQAGCRVGWTLPVIPQPCCSLSSLCLGQSQADGRVRPFPRRWLVPEEGGAPSGLIAGLTVPPWG